ncbi:MAG: hypothetical protein ACUVX8_09620 [Candidatus Zipacnadales bacterium]
MAAAVISLFPSLSILAQPGSLRPPRIEPEQSFPVLDPNQVAFPFASLVDLSPTLDPPAGKHGFLFAGTDGRLYFQDGTRARFWGLNIAKDAVFVPNETIEQVATVIAAAGFNLVRLHHLDDVGGLLPPVRAGTNEPLDPDKLDRVFYWVHTLKQRGIYVYLDLLDFRTFQEAEGVPEAAALGRGAKPAAVFNERLIELQIEYARRLLFANVNPYTKLPLGEDPAVVMVELCDENGLFAREGQWDDMPAPYRAELEARWNFWLRTQYGTTPRLREAWADGEGNSALGFDERLENSSVQLLASAHNRTDFPSPTGAPRIGRLVGARQADLNRFCYQLHREYFAQMKRALRGMGLRVPITAVTHWEHPADLRASAEELDVISCNWYYDHPVFSKGRDWHLPSYFTNSNPIADDSGLDFTASVLRAAVAGKPLIVREWGVCWPNKFRGGGIVEAAAYAALQDLDALILFTYNADPTVRRIEYFDISSDPVRWGIAALAGYAYRAQALSPAHTDVTIAHTLVDSFTAGSSLPAELMRLGWQSRLRQLLCERVPPANHLLSFSDPSPGLVARGTCSSDTGELHRLIDNERLVIDAPCYQVVAGALGRESLRTRNLTFTSASPLGVIVSLSLNTTPLAESDQILLKMVTVATNDGEQKEKRNISPPYPQFSLQAFGTAPIHTHGERSSQATTVDLNDKPLLTAQIINGTWELIRKGGVWYLWCDTPNVQFNVLPLGSVVRLLPFTTAGAQPEQTVSQPFSYPPGSLFVRLESVAP